MDYQQLLRVMRRTMNSLGLRPPLTCEALAAALGHYLGVELLLVPSTDLLDYDASGVTGRDATRCVVRYDAYATYRRRCLIIFHELAHLILGHPLALIDHSGLRPGASDTLPTESSPDAGYQVTDTGSFADPSAEDIDLGLNLIDPRAVAVATGVESQPLFGAGFGLRSGGPWKQVREHDSAAQLREQLGSVYSVPIEWEAETAATICWGWSVDQAGCGYMTDSSSLARTLSFDERW